MAKKTLPPDVHTEAPLSLSTPEPLEAILFQFVNLYERWSEDRQVMMKQSADMAKSLNKFSQQLVHLSELEDKVKATINTRIQREVEHAALDVGWVVGEAAKKAIGPTVEQLKVATEEVSQALSDYRWHRRFSYWVGMGSMMFAALGVSAFIMHVLMPAPTLPLTDRQMSYCSIGEELLTIWPTLSKETQAEFSVKVEDKDQDENKAARN